MGFSKLLFFIKTVLLYKLFSGGSHQIYIYSISIGVTNVLSGNLFYSTLSIEWNKLFTMIRAKDFGGYIENFIVYTSDFSIHLIGNMLDWMTE